MEEIGILHGNGLNRYAIQPGGVQQLRLRKPSVEHAPAAAEYKLGRAGFSFTDSPGNRHAWREVRMVRNAGLCLKAQASAERNIRLPFVIVLNVADRRRAN